MKKRPEKEAIVYIGKTLGNGILIQNTVFSSGEVPEYLLKEFSQIPDFTSLFVPVSQLGEARKRLRDKGDAFGANFPKSK